MRSQFPHRLYTQKLFCRCCKKVTEHGVFAREVYSTYGGMDPRIPLLCSCDACGTLFVAISSEFDFCRREFVNQDYAKIYGYNRIVPGNWVYFKGAPKPALVKSIFMGPEKEVLVVTYDGGAEQKLELPKVVIENEDAPGGYRLLPAQCGEVLIGDPVYHAIRNQFGVAVGLVNDGEKDKLAVLLKDNTLVFITRPPLAQNLPNDRLLATVENKIRQLFPDESGQMSIEVGQGIVYLKGSVKNLSLKRNLEACVNGIPKVRGCVNFMRIQAEPYVTDTQIEKAIYVLLENPAHHLFDYSVQVRGGKVQVNACCQEEFYSKEIESRIAEIPGVIDLSCSISIVPEESPEIIRTCRELEADLALNSRFKGTNIRVSYANKKFLLEGHVFSPIQKHGALLVAIAKIKTRLVENRLRLR
ncbi:BON domain-containing protein [uncultured Fibrobacter sp.]|uniref:BON domain-containing protein n=1 Tax=uncultured Fibrobacter sp. TaxID=261512 RepID=UPI00262D4E3F|nr:BON domain-containing protein [uncultured Fibrobacter sp.]